MPEERGTPWRKERARRGDPRGSLAEKEKKIRCRKGRGKGEKGEKIAENERTASNATENSADVRGIFFLRNV